MRLIFSNEIFDKFKNTENMNVTLVRLFYRLSDIYDCLSEHEISMRIADVVLSKLELLSKYPIEQARMLSGIAYSINNCFENMADLDKAKKMLDEANQIMNNVEVEQEDKLFYVQTRGRVLSNYGSNCISKGRCNQRLANIYFNEAVEWHTKALEFRRMQLDRLIANKEYMNIIKGEVANSYTNIATSFFYLKKYEDAITYHLKAANMREELGLKKAKTINVQRIVGCSLEMYKHDLEIEIEYWRRDLNYYPKLLEYNYYFEDYKSFKINLKYFWELFIIISNDKRFSLLINELMKKKKQIVEWIVKNEDLHFRFYDYIMKLKTD